MENKIKNVKCSDLHKELKQIVADEIKHLPELLEQLEPKERVKAVLQLLPFTAPKVENCEVTYCDPDDDWL